MAAKTQDKRREKAPQRALARSALYCLLSQALAYPDEEAVATLQGIDLPQAWQATALLPALASFVSALGEHLAASSPNDLQAEHRRVFSHVTSPDCPPCETFYTSRHVFQETQDLSDVGGFYRAFGLEMAGQERLDHISVELEFMHFLAYKEAYALMHHGPAKARLCQEAQRKFMQDHLGRWGLQFARRLAQEAGGGYYGHVASLTEAFLTFDIDFLRVKPEPIPMTPHWPETDPQDYSCPVAAECPAAGTGGPYAP